MSDFTQPPKTTVGLVPEVCLGEETSRRAEVAELL